MSALLLIALCVPPLLSAAAALVFPRAPRRASWINAITMPVSLGAAIALAWRQSGADASNDAWLVFRVDALSALLALLVAGVATLAAWLGPGLSARETVPAGEIRTFRIYANAFAATMLFAVTASNLGLMWVAIEASAVASALLIPVHRSKASIEASWKYLLIGSVGIALAFTGTVLAFVDYTATGGQAEAALNWSTLRAAAPLLHPEVMRLAFVFLLVGFGTKAGLVPMHTWLPDAHSEAPAPLSAMMSGVLLAVALYALARWKIIVDVSVGPGFSGGLLLTVALATILIGSLSLATQRQYKRLLAYSSIEHTGLACFGLALGPIGVVPALLHLTGHALAKSTAFLLSGRMLDRYRTQDMTETSGVLTALPATGALFGASVLALVGFPPFSLFLSEVLLIRAGWLAGYPVLTIGVLILMLIAFGSLLYHLQRMLLGDAPATVPVGERTGVAVALLAVPLAVLVWLGVWMPASVQALLERAAQVLYP
ncbi:MAG: proton-conducting transporter membrane subunit [Vicinamibacterales bacterium]